MSKFLKKQDLRIDEEFILKKPKKRNKGRKKTNKKQWIEFIENDDPDLKIDVNEYTD